MILWNYKEHLETGLLVNYHNYPGLSKYFDGNSDNHHFFFKQGRKISETSGFYGIFQIFPPSQGTQAMLTQETKKV